MLKHTDGDLKLCEKHADRIDSLTFLMRDNKLDPNDFKFLKFNEIKPGDQIFEGFSESVKIVKKIWACDEVGDDGEEDDDFVVGRQLHLECVGFPMESFHEFDEINAILKTSSKAPSKVKKPEEDEKEPVPVPGEPQLFSPEQVRDIMNQLGRDMKISLENVIRLNSLFWRTFSIKFLSYRGYRFFVSTRESLDFLLYGELIRHGVSEGIKAIEGQQLTIKPTLNLQRILETLRGAYGQHIQFPSEDALPYFAAVIEYLLSEILELAVNRARDEEREEVEWKDVDHILVKDEELSFVFGRKKNFSKQMDHLMKALFEADEEKATMIVEVMTKAFADLKKKEDILELIKKAEKKTSGKKPDKGKVMAK
jgi:histone H3/H4